MNITNITNICNSKIRFFPLQTQDIYFILYQDLPSSYLISLLIERIGFHLNQFSIEYVYPFRNYFEYIAPKLENFEEEYFLFFLENYYHSSDYAYNFLLKILTYLEQNNIQKKVIVYTLKSTLPNIKYLFEKFTNVVLVVNTDIEYFFNELLYKKTNILDIWNIYFRDDEGNYHETQNENVDYDLGEYIVWWYHNEYFMSFPKSLDEIIAIRSHEKKLNYNDNIFYQWTNEKYIKTLRNINNDAIMLTTGRWCRFNCTYCYRWVKYSKVRQIPLDMIKKDLDYIQKLGYKNIYLYDDCFVSTNENRLDKIVSLFSEYNFSYQIASRYETLNEINLEKLSWANITVIQVWLQSISKIANRDSKRNIDIEKFKNVIENMKLKGIEISIDLILWLPGDYLKDFLKTFHFAVSLSPSSIFINKLFLNPKTELHSHKSDYGIVTEEDNGMKKDFYVPNILYHDSFSENDIKIAQKYVLIFKEKYPNINIILR